MLIERPRRLRFRCVGLAATPCAGNAGEYRLSFQVVGAGDGSFRILDSETGEPVVVDGEEMAGLSAPAAAEYLYALSLIRSAGSVPEPDRIRSAVRRSLRQNADKPVRAMDDAVVAVRWMLPQLGIADDVLRLLVRRFAAEVDVVLLE